MSEKFPILWMGFEHPPSYETWLGCEPTEERIKDLVACHFDEGGGGYSERYIPESRIKGLMEKIADSCASDVQGRVFRRWFEEMLSDT